uniref:Uncharacterized protein n=1 Tax=Anguilla anguilla TaxID=7936 RepID=A0A0E9TSE2_ANGAN
MEVDQLEN